MIAKLLNLTPENFAQHDLHNHERIFRETNCYTDLLIEVIHALGLNPIACLGFTLASDFEGDQWTFGKPSHDDLFKLYGLRIEELTMYRSMLEQMVCQVQMGSVPMIEVDAHFLPDTQGIDYRQSHTKTTIGITQIDIENKSLCYFHNATFTRLEGDDFTGIFLPSLSKEPAYLAPYCEILKLNNVKKMGENALKTIAFESAALHFSKRTTNNPIETYAQYIMRHQDEIIQNGHQAYHAYTFVAPRQLGAAHELGADFLRWLNPEDTNLCAAANAFTQIASLSKTLVLKLARINHTNKPANVEALLAQMHACWCDAERHLIIGLKRS
jgi:hypothetical protein